MINAEIIRDLINTPYTYVHNGREITIKRIWVEGDAVWVDIDLEGIDLGDTNPFGIHDPQIEVPTGEYEIVDEEPIPILENNPVKALKDRLNGIIDWVIRRDIEGIPQ